MELISYNAILASSRLSRERGPYETFPGSKWERGILPQDTIDLLENERGRSLKIEKGGVLDWKPVREHVKKHGMRNSNTMAIAPTATISNIAGCFPCIEPIYKNIYVKSNMSGEFTIVNRYLINDLKARGLWSPDLLEKIKYYDGSLEMIEEIPDDLKTLYQEAFDIDPVRMIQLTAHRAKWIDQSQSHNVFMRGTSGKMLSQIYMAAWEMGLKTTYYLRTLGASQIEKSTLDAKKYGYTQKRSYAGASSSGASADATGTRGTHPGAQSGVSVHSGTAPGAHGSDGVSAAAGGGAESFGESNLSGTYIGGDAADTSSTGEASYSLTSKLKDGNSSLASVSKLDRPATEVTNICSLTDPDCEACQ
jgi:ribonucleoside-diphosphate reductase alpha chain